MSIISRDYWGGKQAGHKLTGPLPLVIIHHTYRPDVRPDASEEEEIRALRGVDRYHTEQGWGGSGYSFGVFQSGRAYQIRGWLRSGAHTKGQNSKGHAICFFMDGSKHAPTAKAIAAAKAIIAEGLTVGAIAPTFHVKPHDAFTVKVCPGERIKAILPLLGPTAGRVLRFGDRGQDVKLLQDQLRALGFLSIDETTEYYGPMTRDAVKAFQRSRGFTGRAVDGIVGPRTRAQLNAGV
jgi:N-acetylmuramoyl-L-alanine amidase